MVCFDTQICATLPTDLNWDYFLYMEAFQRCIQIGLKRQLSNNNNRVKEENLSSNIFNHFCFYHAFVDRKKSMKEISALQASVKISSANTTSELTKKLIKNCYP